MSAADTVLPLVTGVILAGGEGRRFGGIDKGLMPIAGISLLERVLLRLAPQVDHLLIVANRSLASYRRSGIEVIEDLVTAADAEAGFLGPLAGMLSALRRVKSGLLLIVPVDAAVLPLNLARQMLAAGAPAVVAEVPVCALLSRDHLPALEAAWAAGERSPARFLESLGAERVSIRSEELPCWSVNTPEQLDALEARLRITLH